MAAKTLKTLVVRSRRQWRQWLEKHHHSQREIWLVFFKRHSAETCISYEEAIEEAICFGWVDSLVRRLDEDRYARKFTPRKSTSRWSTINRRRYSKLKSLGLLAPSGLARTPTARSGDAPRPNLSALPAYIDKELASHARARAFFQQLAPSCRRMYIAWIDSAKKEETKKKRLRKAISLLEAGKKLGLK